MRRKQKRTTNIPNIIMKQNNTKPGIYKNVPMEEYQKWDAVHKSMFHHILKSSLHLQHYLDHGEEDRDIMVFGNLVDCLLLEPELFESRYIITPETYPSIVKKGLTFKPWSWNANYCKEWRDQKSEENPGIKIISNDDLTRAKNIVERILAHPTAGKWLLGSDRQVSLSWIDPETDLPCKGRMDAFDVKQIIDLKITHNAHPSAFARILNDFKYHAGAAFYHDGLLLAQGIQPEESPSIPCSFIVAEDEPPHDVICYYLGPQSFEVGRIIYREAMQRYKDFIDTGDRSGYSNVAEEIEIPGYALNKVQLEGVIV